MEILWYTLSTLSSRTFNLAGTSYRNGVFLICLITPSGKAYANRKLEWTPHLMIRVCSSANNEFLPFWHCMKVIFLYMPKYCSKAYWSVSYPRGFLNPDETRRKHWTGCICEGIGSRPKETNLNIREHEVLFRDLIRFVLHGISHTCGEFLCTSCCINVGWSQICQLCTRIPKIRLFHRVMLSFQRPYSFSMSRYSPNRSYNLEQVICMRTFTSCTASRIRRSWEKLAVATLSATYIRSIIHHNEFPFSQKLYLWLATLFQYLYNNPSPEPLLSGKCLRYSKTDRVEFKSLLMFRLRKFLFFYPLDLWERPPWHHTSGDTGKDYPTYLRIKRDKKQGDRQQRDRHPRIYENCQLMRELSSVYIGVSSPIY